VVELDVDIYVCVQKKKSEQHLRDILTSWILGRGLIPRNICHLAGSTAQWLLLHATILQFLYSFSTVSFKALGQDHTHQFITVSFARTRGVTSSMIFSLWLSQANDNAFSHYTVYCKTSWKIRSA